MEGDKQKDYYKETERDKDRGREKDFNGDFTDSGRSYLTKKAVESEVGSLLTATLHQHHGYLRLQ